MQTGLAKYQACITASNPKIAAISQVERPAPDPDQEVIRYYPLTIRDRSSPSVWREGLELGPMRELDANEIEALIECVDAVLLESVVPDWEFHTLIGFEKSKIREMFSDSDDFIDMNHERVMAISNIASAVLFYPHEIRDYWSKYFSFSRNLLNIINKKIQNNINK